MYLLISIICLSISFFLFKKVAGTLDVRKLNMISWVFFYSLVLQSFIASVLVVYKLDEHYLIGKLYFDNSRLYGWLSIQYTLVAIPIGMLLVMFAFGKKTNHIVFRDFIKKPLSPSITRNDIFIRQIIYLISFISVLSIIYTYASLKTIPFLSLFSDNKDQIAIIRQQAYRGFDGFVLVRNIFGILLTPVLSYIVYCYYVLYRDKKDWYIFLILFISSFLILIFDLSKSPVILYLLGFVFLKIALGHKFNYMKLGKSFLLIMSFVCITYFLTADISSLTDLFLSYNTGITGRIILSQAAGTYFAFDIYPYSLPFIGFDSLSSIFGGERERMAREIMAVVNPTGFDDGVAGVVNTLFIAEAWANFGVVGVLLAPIIVGVIIQLIYQNIIMGDKTPIKVGIYAYLCYKIPVTGGFNDFIYNPSLFILIFLFIFICFLSKRLNSHG